MTKIFVCVFFVCMISQHTYSQIGKGNTIGLFTGAIGKQKIELSSSITNYSDERKIDSYGFNLGVGYLFSDTWFVGVQAIKSRGGNKFQENLGSIKEISVNDFGGGLVVKKFIRLDKRLFLSTTADILYQKGKVNLYLIDNFGSAIESDTENKTLGLFVSPSLVYCFKEKYFFELGAMSLSLTHTRAKLESYSNYQKEVSDTKFDFYSLYLRIGVGAKL